MVAKQLEELAANLSQSGLKIADNVNEFSGYYDKYDIRHEIDMIVAELFRLSALICMFLKQSDLAIKERNNGLYDEV
jgi:hypothetical protein